MWFYSGVARRKKPKKLTWRPDLRLKWWSQDYWILTTHFPSKIWYIGNDYWIRSVSEQGEVYQANQIWIYTENEEFIRVPVQMSFAPVQQTIGKSQILSKIVKTLDKVSSESIKKSSKHPVCYGSNCQTRVSSYFRFRRQISLDKPTWYINSLCI